MMKKKPLFVSVIISLMLVVLTTHSASRRTATLEGQDDEWELVDESTPHLPSRDSARTFLERLFGSSSTANPVVTSKPAHMLETHVREQLQRINTLADKPKRNTMQATAETQTAIPQMQGDSQKTPESPVAQPKSTIKRQTAPVPQPIHAIIHSHTTHKRPGEEHQLYSKQLRCSKKQTVVKSKPAHMLEAHVKEQLQRINTMQAAAETQTTIPQMQEGDSQKTPEPPVAQPKSTIKRQTAPVPQLIHAIIHSHTTRRRPGKEHQLYSKQLPCSKKQTVLMVTEQRSSEAETRQRKTRSCLSSVLHCLKTLMQWN